MAKFAPPTWVIHMATRRPAHKTPIHMDLGPFQRKPYKKSMWIGVLWAGLRVAMRMTHVGGNYRHGLLEKSLIVFLVIINLALSAWLVIVLSLALLLMLSIRGRFSHCHCCCCCQCHYSALLVVFLCLLLLLLLGHAADGSSWLEWC